MNLCGCVYVALMTGFLTDVFTHSCSQQSAERQKLHQGSGCRGGREEGEGEGRKREKQRKCICCSPRTRVEWGRQTETQK